MIKLLRKVAVSLSLATVLAGSTAVTAQQTPPPDSSHANPPREQRKSLDEYTQAVSSHLPAEPVKPVQKKNYIDNYIFGKMEKDRIPHAGLSSDTEFFRRIN